MDARVSWHAQNGGRHERPRTTVRHRPRRALVVNTSADRLRNNKQRVFYNLGARKIAAYLRTLNYEVVEIAGDPGPFGLDWEHFEEVYVSAIFSWHVPAATAVTINALRAGAKVYAGGPAFNDLRSQFFNDTGIVAEWKPNPFYENVRGHFRYAYAVRGCAGESVDGGATLPCSWCPVPKIEGTKYVLNEHFEPAPFLLDNNLSGMPIAYQTFVINRYLERQMPLVDANSGFEPGRFDLATRARWSQILRGPWRWGFDRIAEIANAKRMGALLADVRPRMKQVYAMCGNEPIEVCFERASKVIEWGCEPWVQFFVPLGARHMYDPTYWPATSQPQHDWTAELGFAFSRYYKSRIYKSAPIWEYKPWVGRPAPFAFLKPRAVA